MDYSGIARVILFGSVARSEDRDDSDIDLLIISTNKIEAKNGVMRKVTDILLETGIYVSAKVISPEEFEQFKNTHFISQVKKEGINIG